MNDLQRLDLLVNGERVVPSICPNCCDYDTILRIGAQQDNGTYYVAMGCTVCGWYKDSASWPNIV